jgi:DNA polymerase
MYLHYPMLRKTQSGYEYIRKSTDYRKVEKGVEANWTYTYGGKITENVVQALAALVIREQMAVIGQHYPLAFQVHDEIIIASSEPEVAQAKLIEVMSTPPKWAPDLPVACEAGFAENYGDT